MPSNARIKDREHLINLSMADNFNKIEDWKSYLAYGYYSYDDPKMFKTMWTMFEIKTRPVKLQKAKFI